VAAALLFVAACGSGAPSAAPDETDGGEGRSPPSVAADAAPPPADGSGDDATMDASADASADANVVSVPGQPFPIEGFGAGTLGGWQPGHDVYHVTTLADDGAGSLREGTRTNGAPRVIRFDLDGDIALLSPLVLPSNLTIDGRARDVTLRGKGLVIPGSDQIILTGFALADVGPNSEDGVQIGHPTNGPSEWIVLDHLRFEQTGDGGDSTKVDEAISVLFGSRFITIAWCRFLRWEKVMLFGNGDAPAAVDSAIRATVHHNWAQGCGRRHPQARHGFYDFFDNFWDDWRMFGWFFESPYRESFGAQAQDGARILFENNLVRRDAHGDDVGSEANEVTRCETGGIIDERGTWIAPDSTAPLVRGVGCPAVGVPLARPYVAKVDAAGAGLRALLEAKTGNRP
jgi:pectate lyase